MRSSLTTAAQLPPTFLIGPVDVGQRMDVVHTGLPSVPRWCLRPCQWRMGQGHLEVMLSR